MAYLRRRNRVDDLSNKQRNPFLKALSLIVLGASVSLFLVNADLIINPQISNSIAYIKQFFVTSDGTSSGTVGVVLDNSGVFSKLYCNLSGSLCKTTEDLFAVDAQLSGLVPRDDGQYTLFASGGKLFTGGLKSTISGYSLATKLSIGYASPTNALDVLGSVYISGSAEIIGSLTVPLLSGIASINGVNIGNFATWDTLVTNGFLTGGQVDTKINIFSGNLMAYIGSLSGLYLTGGQVDAKINILSGNLNTLSKATLPCTQNQLPQFSGGVWICGTIAAVAETDPIWTAASGNYVTNSSLSTTLGGYATTASLNNYVALSQTGNWNTVYNWYAGNPLSSYYTTGQINAKNYISGAQVPSYETDPDFHGWFDYLTYGPSDWDTAYNWGNHASQGYLTSESDPQVGTLTSGKRCTSNGTIITCSSNSPVTGEVDPTVPANVKAITAQNITDWGNAFTSTHLHGNKTTIDSITAQNVLDWGTAFSSTHSHLNGSTLALISGQALTNWNTVYNWYNGNPLSSYATTASLNDYVALSQTGNWNTVYNWYVGNPLSSYVALSQTGNWNTVYNWYVGNPLSSYVALSQTGNWNTAYTFVNNATTNNRLVIDTANDRIGIGTGAPGYKLTVQGTGLFTNSVFAEAFLYNSDRRLKTNIVEITDPLEKITQLHGYTFDWKDTGRHDIGVIAQEVESVFPEAVVTKDNGFKTVNYPSLVAPIIQAVKTLYAKYLDQQDQIDLLKAQVTELKNIVNQLQ